MEEIRLREANESELTQALFDALYVVEQLPKNEERSLAVDRLDAAIKVHLKREAVQDINSKIRRFDS